MGKVLKVTWITNDDGSFQPILIESMQVAKGDINSDLAVNFLAFEKTIDPVSSFFFKNSDLNQIEINDLKISLHFKNKLTS